MQQEQRGDPRRLRRRLLDRRHHSLEDLEGLERVRVDRSRSREELFDRLAEDWDALRSEILGGRLAACEVASLLLPPGMRIVDAGAGTGVYLPWLAELAGETGRVIAVEQSAAMVRRAADRVRDLPNVEVRRGRIEDLPVEDGWADPAVLDTYDLERRPVAVRNCAQSLENAVKMASLADALGILESPTTAAMDDAPTDPPRGPQAGGRLPSSRWSAGRRSRPRRGRRRRGRPSRRAGAGRSPPAACMHRRWRT